LGGKWQSDIEGGNNPFCLGGESGVGEHGLFVFGFLEDRGGGGHLAPLLITALFLGALDIDKMVFPALSFLMFGC